MLTSEVEELEIEMTTLCNAQCPLCYRNYKSFPEQYRKPVVRDLNNLCSQLDTFVKLRYAMVVGSMSEPTLYPYLIDLVKYLKKRNIVIEICTNGSTNDINFWKELGNALDDNDMVYFTICGSTQEIHEKYRVGTNLNKIIKNAAALRSVRKIDYAQCIRFNYNSDDFESQAFKNLVKNFSHIYMTETFYPKDLTNYKNSFDISLFMPNKLKLDKYNKVKTIAEHFFKAHKNNKVFCQSYECKRQQIDVFGNIYPCYLFLEYSNLIPWNGNYDDILALNHDCCKFCEKRIYEHCVKNKLDYII